MHRAGAQVAHHNQGRRFTRFTFSTEICHMYFVCLALPHITMFYLLYLSHADRNTHYSLEDSVNCQFGHHYSKVRQRECDGMQAPILRQGYS